MGDEPGKVMGLSGHKLPDSYLGRDVDGSQEFILTSDWYYKKEGVSLSKPLITKSIDNFLARNEIDLDLKENTYDFYLCAEISHKLQVETFKHTCTLIEKAIKLTGKNKIVLSGGYFLNCVNNYKYTKKFPELEFFVDPISHDGGTAIGAAKYVWYGLTKNKEKNPLKNLYIGPS